MGRADEFKNRRGDPNMELTRNEKYIANAMGVKVPFLPVCGKDEKKLFCGLVALAGAGPGSK